MIKTNDKIFQNRGQKQRAHFPSYILDIFTKIYQTYISHYIKKYIKKIYFET